MLKRTMLYPVRLFPSFVARTIPPATYVFTVNNFKANNAVSPVFLLGLSVSYLSS